MLRNGMKSHQDMRLACYNDVIVCYYHTMYGGGGRGRGRGGLILLYEGIKSL